MYVSLIIPAYNEEQRLGATLELYGHAFRSAYGNDCELLVVANGCTDRTIDVARRAGEWLPQLRAINVPQPVGKGGAVLEGFTHARGERVLFADADGATAPHSLIELVACLDRHDVAIGSRRVTGSTITQAQPMFRRVLGTLFMLMTRLLFRMPFHDTQCGAKAFRARAARVLVQHVQEQRWAFDVDLLRCSGAANLSVHEHPIVWEHKAGSQLRVGPTLRQVTAAFWRMYRRPLVANASGTPYPVDQGHSPFHLGSQEGQQ